jgi:transposase-like protein
MGQMKGRKRLREEAVTEYLGGEVSYRELGIRYGISSSTLNRWVKEHRSGKVAGTEAEKGAIERVAAGLASGREDVPREEAPAETREMERLKRELHEARLYNKLLEAMIDIAEEQMGVVIRKKRGAKR